MVTAVSSQNVLVALHLIELQGVEHINRDGGFAAGDAALKNAAERLARRVDGEAILARLGGVCFTLIQRGISSTREAEVFAQEMVAELSVSSDIGRHAPSIAPTVGYAIAPQQGADLDRLLEVAREANTRAHRKPDRVAGARSTARAS